MNPVFLSGVYCTNFCCFQVLEFIGNHKWSRAILSEQEHGQNSLRQRSLDSEKKLRQYRGFEKNRSPLGLPNFEFILQTCTWSYVYNDSNCSRSVTPLLQQSPKRAKKHRSGFDQRTTSLLPEFVSSDPKGSFRPAIRHASTSCWNKILIDRDQSFICASTRTRTPKKVIELG